MKLEEALREAYRRELGAAPYRSPSGAETAVAMAKASPKEARGAARLRDLAAGRGVAELAPILALAAALVAAVSLEPDAMLALRPLAKEFSSAFPEGSGYRFYDFVIEAGDAYRSSKRSM